MHGSFVIGLRSAQTALPQDSSEKWLAPKKVTPPDRSEEFLLSQ
jgi:hypothetical protein